MALNNIESSFSGYSYSMRNDAILGNIPEFSYSENLKIDDIKINFDLDSSTVNSYNDKYKDISEELSGIKRFNVFRYFEDSNMLLPIETFHDETANRVYAHTTETGTYCLIDMAAWLDSLGFEDYTARAERSAMTYSAERSASNDIDIIFILHSTTGYADFIKDELAGVISSAYSHGNSVHMYFISSGGDIYMINGREYAETAEECMNILRRFRGSVASENVNKAFLAAKGLELRDGSQRHMFMFDGLSMPACGSANSNLNDILKNDVNFGIICNSENNNIVNYNKLANNNVRENIVVFNDFILNQINFTDIPEDEEYVITANGLVPMPENFGDISIASEQDYDNDGLSDVTEINFDVTGEDGNTLITVNSDGSVTLPIFSECIAREDICVINSLNRFYTGTEHLVPDFLNKVKIVPLRSDPTSKDGDGDGIEDIIELRNAIKDDGRIDVSTKTPTSPLVTNTILNILECDGVKFNTDIENVEEFNEEDDVMIKPQFTLAKEHENEINSPKDGIEFAYGYLGSDKDVSYFEVFSYRNSDDEIVNELRITANVYCKNGKITLTDGSEVSKDEVFNAIHDKWGNNGHIYDCSENWAYDFWGLKFYVSVVLNEVSDGSISGQYKRKIDYKSDTNYVAQENHYSGHYFELYLHSGSSDNRGNYTRNGLSTKPEIHLYSIIKKDGKDPVEKNKVKFCASGAHEFGHVLGLMDAYGEGSVENYYFEPVSHAEIVYDESGVVGVETSGEMMHRSGVVSANDIEMAIFARMTGKYQFFVPIHRLSKGSNTKYGVSPAIRAEYEYRAQSSFEDTTICSAGEEGSVLKGEIYIFDPTSKKYKLKS